MEVVTDFGTRNGLTLCSSAEAHQRFRGSCPECRHGRFNPGPPTSPKGSGFYGHHRTGAARRRFRINRLHAEALRLNEQEG